ncbi:MAG: carbohydrate kinase family protein [Phycisphaerae bacterium]|nr:carbohydrate kinase family protein [Phycisphaerae bacterium]
MSPTPSARARHAAAETLRDHAGRLPRALVGFDGFIDSIIDVVDRRHAPGPTGYARIPTIPAFAERCRAAAGKSTNAEIVVREDRFGGNGPLIAGALAALGVEATFVGCVGNTPAAPGPPHSIHPAFADFAERCRAAGGRVIPVGEPAHTHALEFGDGKLMLNDPRRLQALTWHGLNAALDHALGPGALAGLVAAAPLLAIVNWTNMPEVLAILRGLASDVLPPLPAPARPRVFIDLSDPTRRTDADVREVLAALRDLDALAPVTLGLNLAEAERIAAVLGAPPPAPTGDGLARSTADLRACLGLSCLTIHPREGAAAAAAAGPACWVDGPLCASPRLSTGAGDHFSAGFALAQVLGAPIDACCAMGCAVSGAYVRDAASPSAARLIEMLERPPS